MKLPKGTQELPLAQVKEKGRIDKLRATESDVMGKPGYERYHLVEQDNGEFKEVKGESPLDGSYKWRYRFQQNDGHGNVTREGMEVREMMAPWMRADSERQSKLQGAVERIQLMDEAGSAHFVPVERAEQAERANGWRSSRGRGRLLMRTFGGKLYRAIEGRWVPA